MNRLFFIIPIILILFFNACSTRGKRVYNAHANTQGKSYSEGKSKHSSNMNKKNYSDSKMRPYIVRGIKYYPTVVSAGSILKGRASWYGPDFHGKLTANGERYSMHDMTAAHKTLPMNTMVKVTNQNNGLSAIVRINDRGPFVNSRIIDLSKSAASKINMIGTGTAPVTLEILGFNTKNKKKIITKKEIKKALQKKSLSKFALQIASFSDIDGALKIQERYDKIDGYSTVIKDIDGENGRVFKVWLKGFKSEQEARDYKAQGHFKSAFIVKED